MRYEWTKVNSVETKVVSEFAVAGVCDPGPASQRPATTKTLAVAGVCDPGPASQRPATTNQTETRPKPNTLTAPKPEVFLNLLMCTISVQKVSSKFPFTCDFSSPELHQTARNPSAIRWDRRETEQNWNGLATFSHSPAALAKPTRHQSLGLRCGRSRAGPRSCSRPLRAHRPESGTRPSARGHGWRGRGRGPCCC